MDALSPAGGACCLDVIVVSNRVPNDWVADRGAFMLRAAATMVEVRRQAYFGGQWIYIYTVQPGRSSTTAVRDKLDVLTCLIQSK